MAAKFLRRLSGERREIFFIRGKTEARWDFGMRSGRGGNREVSRPDSFTISFHTFTSRLRLLSLFTSCSHPPFSFPPSGFRLGIGSRCDKRKSELYFPFSLKKILTIKIASAGSDCSLVCVSARAAEVVRQNCRCIFFSRKFPPLGSRRVAQNGSRRGLFARSLRRETMTETWKKSGWENVGLAACLALANGACSSVPTRPQCVTDFVRYVDAMQRYLRPLVRRYVAYNLGIR